MEKFNTKKNQTLKILLTTTEIGREGLNLTRARYIVLLDILYDPGKSTQAFRRTARKGNLNPKIIGYQLFVKNLISDSVARGKTAVQQFFASCGIKGSITRDSSIKPVELNK